MEGYSNSAGGGGQPEKMEKRIVRLLDHCIFCLRRTQESGVRKSKSGKSSDELRVVPKVGIPVEKLVPVFNLVWPWVQKEKRLEGMDGGPSDMTRLPPLCQFCGEKVLEVERAMQEVGNRVRMLRSTIEESHAGGKHGWRRVQFKRDLEEANVAQEEIESTWEFLECLGGFSGQSKEAEGLNEGVKTEELSDEGNDEDNEEEGDFGMMSCEDNYENEVFNEDSWIGSEDVVPSKRIKLDNSATVSITSKPESSLITISRTGGRISSVAEDSKDRPSEKQEVKFPPAVEIKSKVPIKETLAAAWSSTLERYSCPEENCNYSVKGKKLVLKHFSTNHAETYCPFPCTCGRYFATELGRRSHYLNSRAHPKLASQEQQAIILNQTQKCDLCWEEVSFENILKHLQGHVGDYAIKCPNNDCPYAFSNSLALYMHLRDKKKSCHKFWSDQANGKYICNACGFSAGLKSLRTHLKVAHERGSDKQLSCPLPGCDKPFAVKQSVDFHIGSHDELKPITSQKCKDCGQNIDIGEVSKHLKEVHNAEEILECCHCPCKFGSGQELFNHLYEHKRKEYFCRLCSDGVKFSRLLEIRQHYITVHQWQLAEYPCEKCGKTFIHLTKLNRHKREHVRIMAPPKQTVWKCEVEGCGRIFYGKKYKLTNHVRQCHKGREKEHICPVCGMAFWIESQMKMHHDLVHLGLRPWVCEICGDTFGQKGHLRRHSLMHTGERKFICDICGNQIRSKESLEKHIRLHQEKGEDFKPRGPLKWTKKPKKLN